MNLSPLISIIVPVYNAGQSLHRALESLLRQEYTSLEIIMIDDCSLDNGVEVMQHFVPLLQRAGMKARLIKHERNQGVAAARNTGLDQASGTYIYHVDADDWLEPQALALLLQEAEATAADIVGCNWYLAFSANERLMKQPPVSTPLQALEAMMNGTMRWNLWLFLVRRALYQQHNIRFQPGMDMGEDMSVMLQLFLLAARFSFVDKALYHYGQANAQSLTKTYSDAHITQVTANMQVLEQRIAASAFAAVLGDNVDFLKLNIKLPLLISDQQQQHQRWSTWFSEANGRVLENKALPNRTRMLQWLALKEQFWAVRLYYRLVIKFIYGIIYR